MTETSRRKSPDELRSRRWFAPGTEEKTLGFLAEHEIPFVMVDEPQGMIYGGQVAAPAFEKIASFALA